MKRVALAVILAAGATVAALWHRSTQSPVASSTHAHTETCDCGHEHAVTPTAQAPTQEPGKRDNPTSTVDDITAQLGARLASGEAIADLHSTLVELVSQDPRRALDAVIAVGRNPLEKHDLAAMTAEIWAAMDAAGAWAWAQQNAARLQQPDRDSVYAAVLRGAASTQPATVPAMVDTLLASPSVAAVPEMATQLTREAVAALLKSGEYALGSTTLARWQQTLSPSHVDPALFADLAAAWSENAPSDAATWLLGLPDSVHRGRGLEALALNWAEDAPETALTWATGLSPATTNRDRILATAFERWVDQDSVAAAQWLARHESEPGADQMFSALLATSTLAAKHPRQAVQWAGLIKEPALRLEALKNAVHFWAREDAVAAARYVEADTALPSPGKEELLNIIRKPAAAN